MCVLYAYWQVGEVLILPNKGVKHIHCMLKPIVKIDTGDAINRAGWSPLPIEMEDSTIVFLCVVFDAIFAVIGICACGG